MTRVRTQREVSEYYGKDPKDRSFVSRKIIKWEVIKKDWWYEILESSVTKCNRCGTLEQEITRLKAELGKCSKNATQCSTNTTVLVDNWNNDLLDHLSLMYTYVEQKNEFINKVVKSYYDKFSGQYDWDWAVEKVYKMYQYNPDWTEWDELAYVKSLIS